MRTFAVSVFLTAAIVSAGCGATRKVTSTVAPGPAITNTTVQFLDRDHGKDAQSAVDVWVLRGGSNEIGHLHSVGTKFDDHAAIAPMGVPVSGTYYRSDLNDAQLRIRLTPDGRDDWSFEPRLTVSFSDNTSRTYSWPQVMLDQDRREITLSLSSAVLNP
ncbi:MAG TPA: hypothetical protein VGJ78_04310 [Vicinamibacterales bacterium]|jgi:hypothetical protein